MNWNTIAQSSFVIGIPYVRSIKKIQTILRPDCNNISLLKDFQNYTDTVKKLGIRGVTLIHHLLQDKGGGKAKDQNL